MWWEFESGMGWWMLLEVAFWAAVIALAAWAVSAFRPGEGRDEPKPLDIARERYARGDISREEFGRMRDDLQKAAGSV